ncbi:MAG: signal peptidase I [Nitrososphaerota archaeon]|nr:signal peptidase I [Nitrososphaerota archaeon]MDG7051855.1 signal peptidase I [Nitrososphaerota archaeon]
MKPVKIIFYIAAALLIVLVGLSLMNVAGLVYPVEGVSMQPIIYTGYLAFVHPVNISQLTINQTVVYYNPVRKELVIHRVYTIFSNGIYVKGANVLTNPTPDMNGTNPLLVTQSMIKGEVYFVVPYIGYMLLWPNNYIIIIFFIIVALLVSLSSSGQKDKRAREIADGKKKDDEGPAL